MRTNDYITTPVVVVHSGCGREHSTAQDWLERSVICMIWSCACHSQGCSLVPRNSALNHIQVEFCGGCLVHMLYGCRKP